MFGSLLFILYISEMFELLGNKLYAYADDSTLLAVADRPAVAGSLNMDLPSIQVWCNHWSMILKRNKRKALIVSGSRTVNLPQGNLVLSGVSIFTSPNLDILGVKFNSKLAFEDHAHAIILRISQRIGILRLVKRVFEDISALLRCYYAFIPQILE